MTNTSVVYTRIDTNLKDNAERIPSSKPLAVGAMTREQLDAKLQKGIDSIKTGKIYSLAEIDATLAKEFGI